MNVEAVPNRLRPRVHRKLLGAGSTAKCAGTVCPPVSLQVLHISDAKAGGQEGVLPVGLLSPAPAGIAKDVYIGCPERNSLVDIPVSEFSRRIELGPGLCGDRSANLLQEVLIPARRKADCLGKTVAVPALATPCRASFHQL
jgi:hypothetical protein